MQFVAFLHCMPKHIAMSAQRPLSFVVIALIPIRITRISLGIDIHCHCV